jgi:hypothetical protein
MIRTDQPFDIQVHSRFSRCGPLQPYLELGTNVVICRYNRKITMVGLFSKFNPVPPSFFIARSCPHVGRNKSFIPTTSHLHHITYRAVINDVKQ